MFMEASIRAGDMGLELERDRDRGEYRAEERSGMDLILRDTATEEVMLEVEVVPTRLLLLTAEIADIETVPERGVW